MDSVDGKLTKCIAASIIFISIILCLIYFYINVPFLFWYSMIFIFGGILTSILEN